MNPLYHVLWRLARLAAKALFKLRLEGEENIPASGPAILAMNHQSFLDPPMLGCMVRGEIYYLARRSLFDKPVLKWLLPRVNVIPVDRDGQDRSALKQVIRLLEEGKRVLIFPEGTRSRDGRLLPAKAGLGMIAAKTGAPVVPLRIFGSGKALPRDSGRLRFVPVRIRAGAPLRFGGAVAGKADYQTISDTVMDAIARLGGDAAGRPV